LVEVHNIFVVLVVIKTLFSNTGSSFIGSASTSASASSYYSNSPISLIIDYINFRFDDFLYMVLFFNFIKMFLLFYISSNSFYFLAAFNASFFSLSFFYFSSLSFNYFSCLLSHYFYFYLDFLFSCFLFNSFSRSSIAFAACSKISFGSSPYINN